MIRLVIFDLDNTLVNFMRVKREAVSAAADAMMATSGAMVEMKELASDWRELSAALIDGKDKTVTELQNVAAILDKTGQAMSRSESQVKKLGVASQKLGDASDSVKIFMDMIKVKPNAIVWGMNNQQRAMLDQQRVRESKPTRARHK